MVFGVVCEVGCGLVLGEGEREEKVGCLTFEAVVLPMLLVV